MATIGVVNPGQKSGIAVYLKIFAQAVSSVCANLEGFLLVIRVD